MWPDHSTFLLPESVSQRYARLAHRLGIDTKLHALRHYAATELILAGVDVRAVVGRLGHSGGGITTVRRVGCTPRSTNPSNRVQRDRPPSR